MLFTFDMFFYNVSCFIFYFILFFKYDHEGKTFVIFYAHGLRPKLIKSLGR
jgi:hypothetical protein